MRFRLKIGCISSSLSLIVQSLQPISDSSSSINGFLFDEQMARTSTWSLGRLNITVNITVSKRTICSRTWSHPYVIGSIFFVPLPLLLTIVPARRFQPNFLLLVSVRAAQGEPPRRETAARGRHAPNFQPALPRFQVWGQTPDPQWEGPPVCDQWSA